MIKRPCIEKIVLLFAFIPILLPHMVSDVTAEQASGSLLGEYKALKEAGNMACLLYTSDAADDLA